MFNTRRDLDLELACFSRTTLAMATGAGFLNGFPFTVTARTGPAKREKTLRDAYFTPSAAVRTGFFLGTFFRTRSKTFAARFLTRDLKIKSFAGKHFGEFEFNRVFQVGTPLPAAAPSSTASAPAKEILKKIAENITEPTECVLKTFEAGNPAPPIL